MSETTKIEWCDYSASPWEGCSKVSPGCLNCYAAARDARHLHEPVSHWGKGAPRRLVKGFEAKVRAWNRKAGQNFAFELNANPTVFPSVCDWLDDEVPIEWLARFLGLIYDTPNLNWLLLTKRPEVWNDRLEAAALWAHGGPPQEGYWGSCIEEWLGGDAPPNAWLGASAENQEWADKRIPELLKIPAVGRFLSVEPMLGPVDLLRHCNRKSTTDERGFPIWKHVGCVDWVIWGGESGPCARPCNVDWIRDGVRQCREVGVSPFVKQCGAHSVETISCDDCDPCLGGRKDQCFAKYLVCSGFHHPKGGDPAEWPSDLRVREFPEGLR